MLRQYLYSRPYRVVRHMSCALAATLFLANLQIALAADHRDAPIIANDILGVGPNERAEVLLVNHCDEAVDVEVDTSIILGEPPTGGIPVESLRLEPGSYAIVPLALPVGPGAYDGRRYVSLAIRARTGRCTAPGHQSLQTEIAVVTVNERGEDSKVVRSAGLRSDGDLVQAAQNAASNKLFVGGLAWDAEEQSARLIIMNHCDTALTYQIEVRSLGTEEQPDNPEGVLEAGEGAVVPLGDEGHMKWVSILGMNFGSSPPLSSGAAVGQCHHGGVSVSAEVYNHDDGSTSQSRGFGFVTFSDSESDN
jgi:hypothetical protein